MIELFNRFLELAPPWVNFVTFVIAIASGLSALTPTPKDDGFFMILKKILAVFSLAIFGAKAYSDIQPK